MSRIHPVTCGCGEWTGEECQWSGPRVETVIVEYMPEQYRASHEAAGNAGVHPVNGSVRVRVHQDCADLICSHEPKWARVVA